MTIPAPPTAPASSPLADPRSDRLTTASQDTPTDYEQQHVHAVYEQIAAHFSSTRYKPWPIIERFLQSLSDGSIGLDIGCGNGKYLAVNPRIYILASDRSTNLTHIASQHAPHSALVADILSLPHARDHFDFAISIAVIHHLSTRARRIAALAAVLDPLRPTSGRALVYCWALEQGGSRRGWSEGGAQDVMVPWVMRGVGERGKGVRGRRGRRTGRGRGRDGIGEGRGEGTEEQEQQRDAAGDADAEQATEAEKSGEADEPPENGPQTQDRTFHRYYHLYRQGELEEDVVAAGGRVVEAGYEKDNWWVIAAKE